MSRRYFILDFSDEDKVRIYSVFGGIPYYNLLIDGKKSVRENIIDLIASPGGASGKRSVNVFKLGDIENHKCQ